MLKKELFMVALFVVLFIMVCLSVDYIANHKVNKKLFEDVMVNSPLVGPTLADGGKPACPHCGRPL